MLASMSVHAMMLPGSVVPRRARNASISVKHVRDYGSFGNDDDYIADDHGDDAGGADGDDDVGIGDSAHKSDDHFDCLHYGNCYLTAYIMFSADTADIVHGAKSFMRLVPYFGAKRNQVLPIWTTF